MEIAHENQRVSHRMGFCCFVFFPGGLGILSADPKTAMNEAFTGQRLAFWDKVH